jgi:hypothetical protein
MAGVFSDSALYSISFRDCEGGMDVEEVMVAKEFEHACKDGRFAACNKISLVYDPADPATVYLRQRPSIWFIMLAS